jgi:hypothetical protein
MPAPFRVNIPVIKSDNKFPNKIIIVSLVKDYFLNQAFLLQIWIDNHSVRDEPLLNIPFLKI